MDGAVERLPGCVYGRYPPDSPMPRDACRFAPADVRLADGLYGLMLPLLALCAPAAFAPTRLPMLFICRFAEMPALGRILLLPRAIKAERPPAGTAPTWLCCIVWRRLDCCCRNETGRAIVPRAGAKKRCEPPLRTVEAAAARPLADKLACVGRTGRFPAIIRAPLSCCGVALMARTLPAPKWLAFTADIALPMRPLRKFATLE